MNNREPDINEPDITFDDITTTNYLSPEKFNQFIWGLQHLEPFTSESGRPPMNSFEYCVLFRILYGCGLRVTEGLNLIKEDFDLKHRVLTIWYPKTAKHGKQKTSILPRDISLLEGFLSRYSNSDQLFPINRQNAWRYAKDAGRLAGLDIFEEHDEHDVEGIFTHLFRKSCVKNMRNLGASIELCSMKLRHSLGTGNQGGGKVTYIYTMVDFNSLLQWEAKNFPVTKNDSLLIPMLTNQTQRSLT